MTGIIIALHPVSNCPRNNQLINSPLYHLYTQESIHYNTNNHVTRFFGFLMVRINEDDFLIFSYVLHAQARHY